jgi:ribosomal protein S18 acetylase RimI-like enzyme
MGMEDLEIIAYEDKFQKQFQNINLHWLKKFELYEKADDQLLNHPDEYITNGATILLAKFDAKIIGTICLNPINKTSYEILKFAVVDGYKGLGIGKKLLQMCIDLCIEKKVESIILESSSKLQNALNMYEKFGFQHIEIKDKHFITADIKMELKLN